MQVVCGIPVLLRTKGNGFRMLIIRKASENINLNRIVILLLFLFIILFNPHPLLLRERKGGRETSSWEKPPLVVSCTWLDQELNPQPFGYGTMPPSTEPHRPGRNCHFELKLSVWLSVTPYNHPVIFIITKALEGWHWSCSSPSTCADVVSGLQAGASTPPEHRAGRAPSAFLVVCTCACKCPISRGVPGKGHVLL